MNIAYCAHVRLPSERAHGHQIAQVCDALVRLGHQVTLLAPDRRNPVSENYHTYYGADPRVQMQYVHAFDQNAFPIPTSYFGLIFSNWTTACAMRSALKKRSADIVYTRSPALLHALQKVGVPVVLELHQIPRFGLRRFVRLCNGCRIVVCLTSPMRNKLEQMGVETSRLIVEGDAVDLSRFEDVPSQAQSREKLGFNTHRIVIGYVGRLKTLGMEKGVSYLLQALANLRSSAQVFGLIVGGPDTDLLEYKSQAQKLGLTNEDVYFTGALPSSEVPVALSACDLLAMPFPDTPHYRSNMSPLKMFEYMAAGKPIISSDLPTIRDVLDEETAIFCKPGDVQSLTDAITLALSHSTEMQLRAQAAHSLVRKYTWEERMKRILKDFTN